ncbi:MAG: glycosyltransferase family 39 protein [Pseudomonadota bacterium]
MSLIIVVIFWALYANFSKYNLDTYRDMLENYSWGIRWQWGNSKHPPVFGWITAAWFEIFPRTNLAYRFLSSINIGVSLALMLLISSRYLNKNQQLATLAVALGLPLLGFVALDYNANSAMIPFWAASFLFYLRVLEKPNLIDGLALGLFAGLAMMVKYHSAVLLLAIFIHSIADKEVRTLWRTPAPWAAAIAFGIAVMPHITWLFENTFSSIRFAALDQGARDFGNIIFRQAEFFVAQFLYALPGLIILGLYRRPKDGFPLFDFAQFGVLGHTAKGRALLVVGLLPVPLTMTLALVLWVPLTSNWLAPVFIFTPILLVLLLSKTIADKRWWTGPAFILVFSVVLLALSPLIRSSILSAARHNTVLPIIDIVRTAETLWDEEAANELAYVGGDAELSYGSSFYVKSRPYSISGEAFESRRWINAADLESSGHMVLCFRPQCAERQQRNANFDLVREFTIPAVKGAGGPQEYKISAYLKLPK